MAQITAYTDYRITQRDRENFRPATCAEVECDAFRNGWLTIVGAALADQVRVIARDTGRAFTERPTAGGLVEFAFPAGQEGFRGGEHDHKVRVDSVQHYTKASGKPGWRVNPLNGRTEWVFVGDGSSRQQLSAQSWVDDFGENQERLAAEQQRG